MESLYISVTYLIIKSCGKTVYREVTSIVNNIQLAGKGSRSFNYFVKNFVVSCKRLVNNFFPL